jgi:glycosyltransferase involved in cell wall biosynthesis
MIKSRYADTSVVIPCFQCAGTIKRAIDSVLSQTLRPSEVILVDDASCDGTLEILRELVRAHSGSSIKFMLLESKENSGAASARNLGWASASARYIAFLDADDSWHPKKLEIQIGVMQKKAGLVLTGHRHIVTKGSIAANFVSVNPRVNEVTLNSLLWRNQFVTSSVVLNGDIRERFVTGQRYMEDHRLWLDLASAGYSLALIDAILAAHHKADYGEDGLSANLLSMEKAELSNYIALYKSKRIIYLTLCILVAWSIFKYIRRYIIVGIRRYKLKHAGH